MFYSNGLKNFYLSSGYGIADYELESFDKALLDAKVGDYNLIKLSSILPPACKLVKEWEELPWPKGSLIPVAYASHTWSTNELCALLAESSEENTPYLYASVSVAIPENPFENGLIMESSGVKSYSLESEYDPSFKMAENGMKNRNRVCKEIKIATVTYDCEQEFEFIRNNFKYITLFACCVLG